MFLMATGLNATGLSAYNQTAAWPQQGAAASNLLAGAQPTATGATASANVNPYAGITFAPPQTPQIGLLQTATKAQANNNFANSYVGTSTPQVMGSQTASQYVAQSAPTQTVGVNEVGMISMMMGATNPALMSASQLSAYLPQNQFQMTLPTASSIPNGVGFIPASSNIMTSLPSLLTPQTSPTQAAMPQAANPYGTLPTQANGQTLVPDFPNPTTVPTETQTALKSIKSILTQMISTLSAGKTGSGKGNPATTSNDPLAALLGSLGSTNKPATGANTATTADYTQELSQFGNSTPTKPFIIWRGKPTTNLRAGFYTMDVPTVDTSKPVEPGKPPVKTEPKIIYEVFNNDKGGRSVRQVDKDGKPNANTPIISYTQWVDDQWGSQQSFMGDLNNASADKAFGLTRRPKDLNQLPYGYYKAPGDGNVFEVYWDTTAKAVRVKKHQTDGKGAVITLEDWSKQQSTWFKPDLPPPPPPPPPAPPAPSPAPAPVTAPAAPAPKADALKVEDLKAVKPAPTGDLKG
jgi:hypothetical protein